MSGALAAASSSAPPWRRLAIWFGVSAIPVISIYRIAVVALLAATASLALDAQTIVALAVIIVLGVPHGALDGEIARPFLQPRFGIAWFPIFALPYLGLAACVLVAWRLAPEMALAAFLAGSALHFGIEDASGKPLEAAVRGGLPIAVPVLFHPAATLNLLGTAALLLLPTVPAWLEAAALCWCLAAIAWAAWPCLRGRVPALLEPALLGLLFVGLPPLPAFATYFVCFHAPRHMAALASDIRAPRVGDVQAAIVRSIPVSLLTVLIGAALWRCFPGNAPDRLVALTIQGLAALTLPHMLLDLITQRHTILR